MPRQPKLPLGLAALALCLAVGLAAGPASRHSAAAEESHAAKAQAKDQGVTHPAATTPGEARAEAIGHATPGGHGGGDPDILEPQPSLALWTVVVFLGLFFVLGRFAWKPLLAALHQREEHLEHVLVETERARNESEQLLGEHRRRLAAAEEQVRTLIDEARKDAQSAADVIVKKAQAEAEASSQRAGREIATAKDQALAEIWEKTADLAVSVAAKVLGKSLNEDDHRRLIDAAIGELPAAPAGANGHGGART